MYHGEGEGATKTASREGLLIRRRIPEAKDGVAELLGGYHCWSLAVVVVPTALPFSGVVASYSLPSGIA